jgi:hypothetical protein
LAYLDECVSEKESGEYIEKKKNTVSKRDRKTRRIKRR